MHKVKEICLKVIANYVAEFDKRSNMAAIGLVARLNAYFDLVAYMPYSSEKIIKEKCLSILDNYATEDWDSRTRDIELSESKFLDFSINTETLRDKRYVLDTFVNRLRKRLIQEFDSND